MKDEPAAQKTVRAGCSFDVKKVVVRGETFVVENISSYRFEKSEPASMDMNAFKQGPGRKEAYLIVTYTNGNSRTLTGGDARELFSLLEAALR